MGCRNKLENKKTRRELRSMEPLKWTYYLLFFSLILIFFTASCCIRARNSSLGITERTEKSISSSNSDYLPLRLCFLIDNSESAIGFSIAAIENVGNNFSEWNREYRSKKKYFEPLGNVEYFSYCIGESNLLPMNSVFNLKIVDVQQDKEITTMRFQTDVKDIAMEIVYIDSGERQRLEVNHIRNPDSLIKVVSISQKIGDREREEADSDCLKYRIRNESSFPIFGTGRFGEFLLNMEQRKGDTAEYLFPNAGGCRDQDRPSNYEKIEPGEITDTECNCLLGFEKGNHIISPYDGELNLKNEKGKGNSKYYIDYSLQDEVQGINETTIGTCTQVVNVHYRVYTND